jgi:hypothetical protein
MGALMEEQDSLVCIGIFMNLHWSSVTVMNLPWPWFI